MPLDCQKRKIRKKRKRNQYRITIVMIMTSQKHFDFQKTFTTICLKVLEVCHPILNEIALIIMLLIIRGG